MAAICVYDNREHVPSVIARQSSRCSWNIFITYEMGSYNVAKESIPFAKVPELR